MIPELGHVALIIALCFALLQSGLFFMAKQPGIVHVARRFVYGQTLFIILAYIALIICFINNDFSVFYVARNSSSLLPLGYRIAAVWGAHEGSMMLWVLILTLWTFAVTLLLRKQDEDFLVNVLATLGVISVGFLVFILLTSNPFVRLLPNFPAQGNDLNPLLQDPGFLFHPPILYMGYVGFAIAFAFAIAALILGRFDNRWVELARPWTLVAWAFLTLGITLGSWWAYRELGWGGWWFWDPVENASFMPWLAGTALVHSLIVTGKRDSFKAWTALLAIIAFSLSLLGTFLVRSGILTSVHAFAQDPGRGAFMLGFLSVVIACSLLLYAIRAEELRSEAPFSLLSRETLLMINNVVLTVAMATVLLGTLYPLLMDALNLGKLSVGAPYFNSVFVPLVAPLFFLMGLGPNCYWQSMSVNDLLNRMGLLFIVSIILGIALPWLLVGYATFAVVVAVALAIWIMMATGVAVWERANKASWQTIPRPFYGMAIAHIGVACAILGIALSSHYNIERDVRMTIGDTAQLGLYQIYFKDTKGVAGPNYRAVDGAFVVKKHNKAIATLHPQKRIYSVSNTAMTDAAILVGLFRDIYIALGEPLAENTWSVRLYYKPFIRFIWLGGFLILAGGLLAATARRQQQH